MGRYRDTRTGVIVNVDDGTALTLGAAYEPAEDDKKTPAKRSASSKSEK